MKTVTHVIYEGPSLFNGSPIVVLYQSGGSKNTKTGAMAQTYILDAVNDPITSSRTGQDASVCGSCIHRGQSHDGDKGTAHKRSCYVTLAHGPLGKYKAYKRGSYGKASGHDAIRSLGLGETIRLGTFGDPASVPQYIWDSLLSACAGWTGYTHGESNPSPSTLMTSADSIGQAKAAWIRGERSFRVLSDLDELDSGEILCPASEEAGKKTNCLSCGLCKGNSVKSPKSIAIVAHGTSKRHAKDMIKELN
jgi:hypothetical protein